MSSRSRRLANIARAQEIYNELTPDTTDPFATDGSESEYIPSSGSSESAESIKEFQETISPVIPKPQDLVIHNKSEKKKTSDNFHFNEDCVFPGPFPFEYESTDLTNLDIVLLKNEFSVDLVESVKKTNYSDKRNYCIYCEQDITHFSRHILKYHEQEFDVQKILSLNKNSKERRALITALRKRGNFIKTKFENELRPVKRLSKNNKIACPDDFLPCKFCLGFYKKNSLYRHTKVCKDKSEEVNQRQNSQSDGQTVLAISSIYKCDQVLKSKIFPRMRADAIGLIAKSDPLICKYAYSYIKGRHSKGNLDFVRTNMRRLAKLLQFARKEDSKIKHLVDILQPDYFQLIVKGVNTMAQLNMDTEKYESPTLAMNFGTLLKKCCDLAYIDFLQLKNSNEKRKELKILKRLVESQWADEVSAQAGSNLSQNQWNKDELLPLTSDLKKLSEYLNDLSEKNYNTLKSKLNSTSYNILKEALYCQIILLNRRRPAEIAQLTTETFKSVNLESENIDEFEKCLSETEKILINTYSRFVIRGKRGRGVPIILSPSMKKYFDFIMEVRSNFVTDNNYIFHTCGKNCIDGTKILHKFVHQCGLETPNSITATRLRKHLTTITQLLQFSNNDMEQLSKFMGHTLKTHCGSYRLSDKIYQTAKVSKLLLLMTEGGIEQFKGKSLDDINIDLTPLYENVSRHIENDSSTFEETDMCEIEMPGPSTSKLQFNKNGPKFQKQKWSVEQKNIIAKHFAQHIKLKKSPREHEVIEFVDKYLNLFQNQKWTSIKAIVYNMYTGKLKYQL